MQNLESRLRTFVYLAATNSTKPATGMQDLFVVSEKINAFITH